MKRVNCCDIVLVPSLEVTSKQIQPLMAQLQQAGVHVKVQSLYGRKNVFDRVSGTMREIIEREAPIIRRNGAKMGHPITDAEAVQWAWTMYRDRAFEALVLPNIPSSKKLPNTGIGAFVSGIWWGIKWLLILGIAIGIIRYLVQ